MPELTIPPVSAGGLNPSPAPPLTDDAELQQFIAAHNLRADLDTAIAISRESFPEATQIAIRLQNLPDDDEFRVIVDARLSVNAADASERYWRLLDRWTQELPLKSQGILVATYTRT